ncbi:triacylglycerol lipase [Calocera viscosa TUFC12733]|uniref:Carboxylic ester hydrolase n=1 Tax=Calocera viscosa (strain TUFC12733) TaxID=1330018 RepID=A0A167LT70_CALVF|nr:triacylglycerol lipase [Calocera viscosa TUFC12733]
MLLNGILTLLVSTSTALSVDPLVNLGYSQYAGTANSSDGVSSWLGIRFAAPPLGDLRWRAPQDPLQNNTVQNATEHGLLCLATGVAANDTATNEDCLFLDVYAPTNATTSSKLPVYFWIQGGGYNSNANANYRGDGLIMASGYNMVVVTFNYRVSLWGFLASNEVVANGDTNIGLLDQRKALEWVQKYISLFGGDPGHVVLGGASAGAGSIALHLTAYGGRDDGLFHAAVGESQAFPTQLTIPQSQYQYDRLVNETGCSKSSDTLACLRALNVTQIQSVNVEIPYPILGANATAARSTYGPVIDGGLVQDYLFNEFTWGSFIKVPVIFGDDTNEGTHFVPLTTANYSQMDSFIQAQFPGLTQAELNHINQLYPIDNQFPNTGLYFGAAADVFGEITLICPGEAIMDAYASYSAAGPGQWNYRYNVLDPSQAAAGLGVSHTVEIGALWGPEWVPGPPLPSYLTTNKGITPVLQGYWTSFVRSFNPNTFRAHGSPEWEQWGWDKRQRILFVTNATTMEVVPQNQTERCAYIDSIQASKVTQW